MAQQMLSWKRNSICESGTEIGVQQQEYRG